MHDPHYNDRIDAYNRTAAIKEGRMQFKAEVLALIRPCLPRDATLQKLMKAIEEKE